MVNFPIWEQCKDEYLHKLEQHYSKSELDDQQKETLSQVEHELEKREQAQPKQE
jgi:hypothetical protein